MMLFAVLRAGKTPLYESFLLGSRLEMLTLHHSVLIAQNLIAGPVMSTIGRSFDVGRTP